MQYVINPQSSDPVGEIKSFTSRPALGALKGFFVFLFFVFVFCFSFLFFFFVFFCVCCCCLGGEREERGKGRMSGEKEKKRENLLGNSVVGMIKKKGSKMREFGWFGFLGEVRW